MEGMQPSRAKPEYSAIKSYIEAVQRPILERFDSRLVSRSHLQGIQRQMDQEWKRFYRNYPGPYLLAEGCSVDGLEAALHNGHLMFRWRTVFINGPRHTISRSGLIPLGFYKIFDLWAAYGYPSRASVLIVQPGGYTEWHLDRHQLTPPPEHRLAIQEALKRAHRVNVFFGSQYARPQPLGRAALPVRKPQEELPE